MEIAIPQKINYSDLLNIFISARRSATGLPDINPSIQEFMGMLNGEVIFTASISNKLVGFVAVWEKENFIHHLYIHPDFQNQGIGVALVNTCKQYFGLPLSLKCVEKNTQACRFYKNNGWHAIDKGIGPEGAYILFRLSK